MGLFDYLFVKLNEENFVTSSSQLHTGYPVSLLGQYSFLNYLIQLIKAIPGGKGKGLFYWEPEWISTPTFGSLYENLTLFDFGGNILNSIRVFKEPYPPGIDSIYIQILSQTSVRLNAIVNSGNQSTVIRFQCDTDSNAVWTNDELAANSPLLIGTASYTLNNLDPDVTYYFRAYVSNDSGSHTSIIKSFNTTPLTNVKIFLEGAYKGNDSMSTNLNEVIPQISPYPESPSAVSTDIPYNITDWVLLQLRSTIDSGSAFF